MSIVAALQNGAAIYSYTDTHRVCRICFEISFLSIYSPIYDDNNLKKTLAPHSAEQWHRTIRNVIRQVMTKKRQKKKPNKNKTKYAVMKNARD